MTLPSSGPMSASMINTELGRPTGSFFNINGPSERALAGVPAGAISMSNFYGKSVGGGGPPPIGKVAAYNGTQTGLSGVPFNVADATRRVVIVAHWEASAGVHRTISSATIGGIAATVHVNNPIPGISTTFMYGVGIFSAAVPTGTSGTVVINFSGGATLQRIGSFSLYGHAAGTTATASGDEADPSGDLTININAGTDGTVIAGACTHREIGGDPYNLTGVTEAYQQADQGQDAGGYTAGANGVIAVSMTGVLVSGFAGNAVVAASWV